MIEQLKKRIIKVEDLHENQLHQLIMAIYPNGKTFMHILFQEYDILILILEKAHPIVDQKKTIKVSIPILPDYSGTTIFHLCQQNENFKLFDVLLQYLKLYPIDHHSRLLKPFLANLINKDLPSLHEYLESRLLQNKQIAQITYGKLKKGSLGIIDCPLNFVKENVDERLFQKGSVMEAKIKCEFIDIPGLYHYDDPDFQDFFGALSNSRNYKLFQLKAIQKIIEFNFGILVKMLVWKLFLPYIIFQVVFVVFVNSIYGNQNSENDDEQKNILYCFLVALSAFSVYFLVNEAIQMRISGLEYFKQIWNYIDFISSFGVGPIAILVFFQKNVDIKDTQIQPLIAVITLFMWFRILSFLRIFISTGYIIQMIIHVIYDIRFFLLLLLITIAAFGGSFQAISHANEDEDQQFVTNFSNGILYTYRMILGDWDTSAFGTESIQLVQFIFVMCTLLVMIVMLNLLIAIISQTFTEITSNRVNASYKEMASLIAENRYLLSRSRRRTYANMNQNLLVATDLESEEKEKSDPFIGRIERLENFFGTSIQNLKSEQDNYQKYHKEQLEQIKKQIQSSNNELKSLVEKLILSPQEREGKM